MQVFLFIVLKRSFLLYQLLLRLLVALNYLEFKPNVLGSAEWLEYVHHKLEQGLQFEVLVIESEYSAADLVHVEHVLDE